MTLSLTVLGSSGTYAGAGNACSGYLVRSGATTVMMDAGPGTLANLQQHVRLAELDAIVLSHEHPDHWLELPVMRNALKYVLGRSGVPLFATAGTLALAEPLCGNELGSSFEPRVISDRSEFEIGELSWRCSRTDHPVETLAFAVRAGEASIAYSADTGPGWALTELADDVGLAVIEATFLDDDPAAHPVHLRAGEAGSIAREARAGRLALTHLLPGSDAATAATQAARTYGGDVELAEVHRTFEL